MIPKFIKNHLLTNSSTSAKGTNAQFYFLRSIIAYRATVVSAMQ